MVCLALCALAACDKTVDPQSPEVATGPALYEAIAPEASGVNFVNLIEEDWQNNILINSYLYNGGGVAVLDYDGDGWEDLYFTSTMGECKLYRNTGDWHFEDVTAAAGVGAPVGIKTGVSVCDVNQDGRPDLYVCRTGQQPVVERTNLLFINRGDGGFDESAEAYGLNDGSASNHANFFDYDGDGDLDVYVINHPVEWSRVSSIQGVPDGKGGYTRKLNNWSPYDTDRLFEMRDGKFVDVTGEAGIKNCAWGLSATAGDFNGDGRDDIFIGNDYIEPDQLYLGSRSGQLIDAADQWLRHSSEHTMGADIADLNSDGRLDLVTVDMLAPDLVRRKLLFTSMKQARVDNLELYGFRPQLMRNQVQLNTGNRFSEVAEIAGLHATDWSWAPLLFDADLDGKRDVFITNGYRRDVTELDYLTYTRDSVIQTGGLTPARFGTFAEYAKLIPSAPLPNFLYLQQDELQFEEVASHSALGKASYSSGSAYADLDHDGDLDLIVSNIDDPAGLYRNLAIEQGRGKYLALELKGAPANQDAIGATVRIVIDGVSYISEVRRTRGFLSASTPVQHFGLPNAVNTIDSVWIRFPDGKGTLLLGVAANTRMVFDYAKSDRQVSVQQIWTAAAGTGDAQLADARAAGLDFRHTEDKFNDFEREPLLPYRLSHEGPCLATGDVDGDGRTDVFVGGAVGQAGKVYVQTQPGQFKLLPGATAALEADARYEDTDAVWLDVDNDGDLDLYVVSGGNHAPAGAEDYRDRLYINERGVLQTGQVQNVRPRVPGSAALAHDVDGDGDEDLFIGSRNTPGKFPEAMASVWLRNDGGSFSDATQQWMSEAAALGMVSDATLYDINGDGQQELVVVGDFQPLHIYQLSGGKWAAAADLATAGGPGLYNCVAGGPSSLLLGNRGLNQRHQTPLHVFAADFDGNGQIDPLLAVEQQGRYLPLIPRDAIVKQLPILKKQFVRYRDYSNAALKEILGEEKLQSAAHLEATTFASQVLPKGERALKELPKIAQRSTIEAALALPDGRWIVAGNNFDVEAESGRLDAGDGLLLSSTGAVLDADLGLSGAVRSLAYLGEAGGDYLVLVGNNDGPLQLLRVKTSPVQ